LFARRCLRASRTLRSAARLRQSSSASAATRSLGAMSSASSSCPCRQLGRRAAAVRGLLGHDLPRGQVSDARQRRGRRYEVPDCSVLRTTHLASKILPETLITDNSTESLSLLDLPPGPSIVLFLVLQNSPLYELVSIGRIQLRTPGEGFLGTQVPEGTFGTVAHSGPLIRVCVPDV
jgi:hypothetical protein